MCVCVLFEGTGYPLVCVRVFCFGGGVRETTRKTKSLSGPPPEKKETPMQSYGWVG